ncbi:hypothetical protein [Mesohalobacter halotolerans]|nr:hypothetical protein [Mesohalobacter halotolerans]
MISDSTVDKALKIFAIILFSVLVMGEIAESIGELLALALLK